jgi:hypothetical protein
MFQFRPLHELRDYRALNFIFIILLIAFEITTTNHTLPIACNIHGMRHKILGWEPVRKSEILTTCNPLSG